MNSHSKSWRVRSGLRLVAWVAPLLLIAVTASAGPLTPNSHHYREHGVVPATGRSGAFGVTTQALFGPSGLTRIYITPTVCQWYYIDPSFCALPGAYVPNQAALREYSLKIPDGKGSHTFVYDGGLRRDTQVAEFRGLGPNVSIGIQVVETQADAVKSASSNRSGQVRSSTRVAKLPDLVAGSLEAPTRGVVGRLIRMQFPVTEVNGDLGATADCTLSVNDVEVDAARAIWVDAGDSVTCRFTHRFDAAGTYRLKARIENVLAPGPGHVIGDGWEEWDDQNNTSGEVTLEIEEPTPGQDAWDSMRISARHVTRDYNLAATTMTTGWTRYDWGLLTAEDSGTANVTFTADLEHVAVDFSKPGAPLSFASTAASLQFEISSDGVLLHDTTVAFTELATWTGTNWPNNSYDVLSGYRSFFDGAGVVTCHLYEYVFRPYEIQPWETWLQGYTPPPLPADYLTGDCHRESGTVEYLSAYTYHQYWTVDGVVTNDSTSTGGCSGSQCYYYIQYPSAPDVWGSAIEARISLDNGIDATVSGAIEATVTTSSSNSSSYNGIVPPGCVTQTYSDTWYSTTSTECVQSFHDTIVTQAADQVAFP